MNKALEQKLIGPMEESHTKEQSPQAILWEVLWARRSKIAAKWARTRAWAGYWCLWEEEEVCGCLPLLLCSQCQIFSNIPEKIIFHFRGIWRTFIFGVFFYCTDNTENRQKILFFLYLIQITESKKRVQKVVPCRFIHLMIINRNPLTRLIKSC